MSINSLRAHIVLVTHASTTTTHRNSGTFCASRISTEASCFSEPTQRRLPSTRLKTCDCLCFVLVRWLAGKLDRLRLRQRDANIRLHLLVLQSPHNVQPPQRQLEPRTCCSTRASGTIRLATNDNLDQELHCQGCKKLGHQDLGFMHLQPSFLIKVPRLTT